MAAFARSLRFVVLIAFLTPAIQLAGTPIQAQTPLQNGSSWTGVVEAQRWQYFTVDVKDWHSFLSLTRAGLFGSQVPQVYIRYGAMPTLTVFDKRLTVSSPTNQLTVTNKTNPKLKTGRYFVGLYSTKRIQAQLSCMLATQVATQPGMGAIPHGTGTVFRVWAPNATSVHVAGDFNSWNGDVAAMRSEGNGNWSIDYRNARTNQQYKYVIRNGANTMWRTDPREENITNSVGNSIIFDPTFSWTDSGFQVPTWNEMVIYELHVGTLFDAPGGRPGNFASVISKLDHMQALGVNAIQLMPVHEFGGDFSWGYNPAHPFTVEEAYGGPLALKQFVNAAHQRGMAVLMDMVHNHYGPSDLQLWQFDGWSQNGKGGIYFYQDDRSSTPWGDTRPDYGRGEVRQYIRDNALMWLNDFHIDGLRWDSVLNMRSYSGGEIPDGWSLVQWVNNEIDASQPWKISIAEDLQDNAWITKDTGAGGAGFDSQWNAAFVHPVRAVIEPGSDNNRNMSDIKSAVEYKYSGDAFERVVYTESHDEVANGRSRVPETIWPGNAGSWFSRKRSTLGAALVMTSPGIPMMFQGQEFLEDGYFQDTDPLDWAKDSTYAGIKLMYTDLIKLRRNWFNNTRGLRGHNVNVFHVNHTDKVVAFHRWDQGGSGDDVVVVCNFRDQLRENYRIGLPQSGVWRVRFNSDWNGYSSDFGNVFSPDVTGENVAWDGMNFSGITKIAPYSVLILSKD
jgi:1,4-alpha-glucan branching enzyme